VGTVLALASAASYGLSDFIGGLLSRRISFVHVALVGQVGGLLSIAVLASRGPAGRPFGLDFAAALAGALAGLALVCYLLATRTQLVAVAVVLSSLYPVIPVLLGITVLRERLTRHQSGGLAAALTATILIATP
jgi:drug/metabolite transporter (DMT)-like permease